MLFRSESVALGSDFELPLDKTQQYKVLEGLIHPRDGHEAEPRESETQALRRCQVSLSRVSTVSEPLCSPVGLGRLATSSFPGHLEGKMAAKMAQS